VAILEESSQQIFPNSHLILTFEAIGKITAKNISELPLVHARAMYSDVVTNGCRLLKSISFRATYVVEEVRRITQIDIYGEMTVSDAIRHMAEQLHDVMTDSSDSQSDFLLVHVPFEFEMEKFQRDCENILGLLLDEEFEGQNHTMFLIKEDIQL
jgi:hypothetical protein